MTERKFKVGDRVKIVGERTDAWGTCPAQTGDEGTVVSDLLDNGRLFGVQLDGQEEYFGTFGAGWGFLSKELELIERSK